MEQMLDTIHHWSLDFHILDSQIIRKLRPHMKWDTNLSMNRSEKAETVAYRLSNYVEQAPNPDSRITLAAKRDMLGLPMAKVDWRLCELDRHGIRVAHGIIKQEVERSGYGHMDVQLPETEDEILAGAKGGAHHMGTTRMHDNPREGVVDANSRVHGLANLYVAGSSVFTTGGYANPTFTILALTIRLADHMKTLFQR
jgi:choline dehydrogenase-like flavoprotein